MNSKRIPRQKFSIGDKVIATGIFAGILTIEDAKWNGTTWLYSFVEEVGRLGQSYLQTA